MSGLSISSCDRSEHLSHGTYRTSPFAEIVANRSMSLYDGSDEPEIAKPVIRPTSSRRRDSRSAGFLQTGSSGLLFAKRSVSATAMA